MEEKNFGNNYDFSATARFIKKWWKLLTVVLVVSLGVSMLVSILITPRFKSTAIMLPSNSNRGSKAILAERYSMDFMDYGAERDCEYAIQIMTSQSMVEDVCNRFDLMEHYEIEPNDPHKLTKMYKMYNSNVTVKRTDYLGVEINVTDIDPNVAADMANYIAANYDTISARIQGQRAVDAYQIMNSLCENLKNEIFELENQIKTDPNHKYSLTQLIDQKAKELAEIQTRATQTKVDMNYNFSHKYMLDEAQPSDKKAYPKRMVITLLGGLGGLAVCILALLIFGNRRKENE